MIQLLNWIVHYEEKKECLIKRRMVSKAWGCHHRHDFYWMTKSHQVFVVPLKVQYFAMSIKTFENIFIKKLLNPNLFRNFYVMMHAQSRALYFNHQNRRNTLQNVKKNTNKKKKRCAKTLWTQQPVQVHLWFEVCHGFWIDLHCYDCISLVCDFGLYFKR